MGKEEMDNFLSEHRFHKARPLTGVWQGVGPRSQRIYLAAGVRVEPAAVERGPGGVSWALYSEDSASPKLMAVSAAVRRRS